MLKLGNVIAKKTTAGIDIFTFNIEHMELSTVPVTVEFRVLTNHLHLVDLGRHSKLPVTHLDLVR